jgi:Uma2 family endonuclease
MVLAVESRRPRVAGRFQDGIIDLYAESGVDEYWLVLAEKGCVEQYSAPASGEYKQCQTLVFESAIVSISLPTVRVDLHQLK